MALQHCDLAQCDCHYYDVGQSSPHQENPELIVSSMAVVHEYPPNYAASLATYATPQGPVQTSGYWPEGSTLYDRINGLMNCVFAYGGATLFNELMAEMRRP